MKTIHLYGALKDKFGPTVRLDVENAAEVIRAFAVTRPDAIEVIKEHSWVLVRRTRGDHKRFPLKDLGAAIRDESHQLDVEMMQLGLGTSDLHIIPVVGGAGGRGGAGKVLLGLAVVAGAWFTAGGSLALAGGHLAVGAATMSAQAVSLAGMSISFGQIAMMGAMMALGGVSSMLAKSPSAASTADTNQSYIFSGPANVSSQSNPVPVVHGGPIRVGSVTVSSAVTNVAQGTSLSSLTTAGANKNEIIFNAIKDS